MVLSAAADDAALKIAVRRIGPALVFERLWEETGCRAVIAELEHGFALERAVFLTVLHRLFVSGSDRAADRWREDYTIAGVAGLDLHHLYRAMAWLGEELSEQEQDGRTPFAPRCRKDLVEEQLFAHRRDLLTRLDWCSWTPPACTSRVPADRRWAGMATARITVRISGR
jgi:hypothetical protein